MGRLPMSMLSLSELFAETFELPLIENCFESGCKFSELFLSQTSGEFPASWAKFGQVLIKTHGNRAAQILVLSWAKAPLCKGVYLVQ